MARIPDPNAFRRDRKDDAAWTVLDPKGKVKDVPEWPLVMPLDREIELWNTIWERPQSVLWEENSLEIEVALYIRRLAEVELEGTSASRHALLQRLMESLSLTTPSMYRAKVKIAHEIPKPISRTTNRQKPQSGIRERLKIVSGLE